MRVAPFRFHSQGARSRRGGSIRAWLPTLQVAIFLAGLVVLGGMQL
jgi:hypothetical protein